MQVLQDKRKCRFAAVGALAFADRAGRRINEICAVISFAVVVAGGTKSQWKDQDQKRGRPRPKVVLRIDQRRVKRSQIRAPGVVGAFEGAVGCVDTKRPQEQRSRQNLSPPGISPERACKMPFRDCYRPPGHSLFTSPCQEQWKSQTACGARTRTNHASRPWSFRAFKKYYRTVGCLLQEQAGERKIARVPACLAALYTEVPVRQITKIEF